MSSVIPFLFEVLKIITKFFLTEVVALELIDVSTPKIPTAYPLSKRGFSRTMKMKQQNITCFGVNSIIGKPTSN